MSTILIRPSIHPQGALIGRLWLGSYGTSVSAHLPEVPTLTSTVGTSGNTGGPALVRVEPAEGETA